MGYDQEGAGGRRDARKRAKKRADSRGRVGRRERTAADGRCGTEAKRIANRRAVRSRSKTDSRSSTTSLIVASCDYPVRLIVKPHGWRRMLDRSGAWLAHATPPVTRPEAGGRVALGTHAAHTWLAQYCFAWAKETTYYPFRLLEGCQHQRRLASSLSLPRAKPLLTPTRAHFSPACAFQKPPPTTAHQLNQPDVHRS